MTQQAFEVFKKDFYAHQQTIDNTYKKGKNHDTLITPPRVRELAFRVESKRERWEAGL